MREAFSFFRAQPGAGWAAAGLCALLSACGGSGSSPQGTLQLAMTDAPGCGYRHVYITVEQIRVHQSANASENDAGWQTLQLAAPRRVDLLELTNGALQELGSLPLPAGRYQQIRLVLSKADGANALVLENSINEIPLSTPSGQQSGYKLLAGFDIVANQVADLVLDFDACQSIVRAGPSGRYNLKPVVSVTPRLTTQIEGYVSPAQASSVVVSTRDPSGQTRATVPDATGRFVLAYLPESTRYTVVLTGSGLTTAAITDVAVSTSLGRTRLNTADQPVDLPPSPTANVSGQVTSGSGQALGEASVQALQSLSGLQTVRIRATPADPDNGRYTLNLPLLSPLVASYSMQGGPLLFSSDTITPGAYQIVGNAPGYSTQVTSPNVTLTTAGSTTLKDLVLAP